MDAATARGLEGEKDFRNWLDRERVDYFWVDQDLTKAVSMRGVAKRPDVIVGFPMTGAVAIDVKAKGVGFRYDSCRRKKIARFSADSRNDIELLQEFEHRFGMPVWFAFRDTGPDAITSGWRFASLRKFAAARSGDGAVWVDASEMSWIEKKTDLERLFFGGQTWPVQTAASEAAIAAIGR